ncbi:hypothetical protein [Pontibacter virosus]|uniref:Uncharacterized protein n=1 Tax=Pontibacter virosus TaxID=1765052 RepID=A0A2U1AGX7_9BACT|nr:hypothetical protein [Pontibacter virosus]PVY35660.1 hypothetical protein C8E01_1322 [Pontibacter virosus]
MRSLKISEDTDYQIELIKMLLAKDYKIRVTKGKVVRYALKALKEKMDSRGDGNE